MPASAPVIIAVLLFLFIAVWLTLTFTNMFCDSAIGFGLCWKKAQPAGKEGACPTCATCPVCPTVPAPAPAPRAAAPAPVRAPAPATPGVAGGYMPEPYASI